MRFLAYGKLTPQATREAVMSHLPAEEAVGDQLYDEGLLVEGYLSADRTDTILFVEADSPEAAQAALDRYPLVHEGLIAFTITPVIGLPSIGKLHAARNQPVPEWWPSTP